MHKLKNSLLTLMGVIALLALLTTSIVTYAAVPAETTERAGYMTGLSPSGAEGSPLSGSVTLNASIKY